MSFSSSSSSSSLAATIASLGVSSNGIATTSYHSSTSCDGTNDALAIMALTLAASASDGICMAIGHIWSSRLLSITHAHERRLCTEEFYANRLAAKARMIDALVGPGGNAMLKIDALSLADTLGGYPDVFVRALLGGGICAEDDDGEEGESYGTMHDAAYDVDDDRERYRYSSMGGGGGVERDCHHVASYDEVDVDCARGFPPPSPMAIPATTTGISSDVGGHLAMAVRTTSLFVASSLVPSLAYCCASLNDCDYRHDAGTTPASHRGILPVLASLSASAIAMFVLGASKR